MRKQYQWNIWVGLLNHFIGNFANTVFNGFVRFRRLNPLACNQSGAVHPGNGSHLQAHTIQVVGLEQARFGNHMHICNIEGVKLLQGVSTSNCW